MLSIDLIRLMLYLSEHKAVTWALNIGLGLMLTASGLVETNVKLLVVLIGMVVIDGVASIAHRTFGPTHEPNWARQVGVKFVVYLIFLPAAIGFGNSGVTLFEYADEALMGVALVTEFTSILLHLAEIHESGRILLDAFRRLTGKGGALGLGTVDAAIRASTIDSQPNDEPK